LQDHEKEEVPMLESKPIDRARQALEGLSVGDAFGERFFRPANMTRLWERVAPEPPWPYTDDTEMALGIVEVLEKFGQVEQDALAEVFARRYRKDPGRGYGGTAHRILQIIGERVPWRLAAGTAFGGQGSMGNGGAMRAAPIGAYFADDPVAAAEQARLSAEVTHSHLEGQAGAIAVAVAAGWAWRHQGQRNAGSGRQMIEAALNHTPAGETHTGLAHAWKLPPETSVRTAVAALGNGSRVLAPDTVPFALWCAARHLDSYTEALWNAIEALGDIDTNCAIIGGIVALATGVDAIPPEWRGAREPLNADEPRTPRSLENLGPGERRERT
jgi:ADP-ribosylglycohydrolase